MHDCGNSITNTLELPQSCTRPSIYAATTVIDYRQNEVNRTATSTCWHNHSTVLSIIKWRPWEWDLNSLQISFSHIQGLVINITSLSMWNILSMGSDNERRRYNVTSLHWLRSQSDWSLFSDATVHIMKIKQTYDCLIFIMGIPILVRHLYWDRPFDSLSRKLKGLLGHFCFGCTPSESQYLNNIPARHAVHFVW